MPRMVAELIRRDLDLLLGRCKSRKDALIARLLRIQRLDGIPAGR
jgi:hypothetical protein